MRSRQQPSIKLPSASSAAGRIVAAARQHFYVHGFRNVTMDDLAAELGMSKKTLYRSFPSKAALLKTVLLDKFVEMEAELDRITSRRPADVLAALHQLLSCVQRHSEEIRPPFVRDMRREPELFKIVESRRREVIQRHFGKLFDEGRKAGVIRKDVPVQMIIEVLLGAVQAIMNPSRMAELNLSLKSGYSTIITVVLEGAITGAARSTR